MQTDLRIPAVYKRGQGVLEELGDFCQQQAQKVIIIGGKKALQAAQEEILASLKETDLEVVGIEWYGGECTWDNIDKLSDQIREEEAELIISVGGGKSLDTGKAVAYQTNLPCVTVPTIAATCAAFTPLSIIYNQKGVHLANSSKSVCPRAVFVDIDIILEAPAKWLFAGMGDTLAKWYELRATTSQIPTTSWTEGGIDNGKICYNVIKEFGPEAKQAVEEKKLNQDLEYVIDAIIFYAGMSSILGGEECRGAASHSIFFGFTNLAKTQDIGHGFLVGFGNLCLLALESRSRDEVLSEIKLAKECGVPIKLSEIAPLSQEELQKVAQAAAGAEDMENMPFKVTTEMVIEAIEYIDELGRESF
ncbi:iron-containing alcohol dehydrogenase family protein [Halanaerocella petrolearia]